MESFPVSPEDCLILRAVHQSASLREAARALGCDAAGLLRKVQRIADEAGVLRKVDGKWRLTDSGVLLVGWVEESILSQKNLLERERTLRLSCYLWMAEQFVLPALKDLITRLPEGAGVQVCGTDSDFEGELLRGKTDFVIACHPPHDPLIAHKNIAPEEWVVLAPAEWARRGRLKHVDDVKDRPFVRHKDMNPDLLMPMEDGLAEGLVVDSHIGVRAAVVNGLGWSFLPRVVGREAVKSGHAVELAHDFRMDRVLSVWWLRHVRHAKNLAPAVCAWAKDVSREFAR